jgi:uncharacterized protein (TIGR00369 family)
MTENWADRIPSRQTVNDVLGITMEEVSPERVVLRMAIGPHAHQSFGFLHGGVSALLAEGAASVGGWINVEPGQSVVGTELNCSHLRGISEGVVRAIATPIRIGRSVQVWAIEVLDENDRQISVARCTLQVIAQRHPHPPAP